MDNLEAVQGKLNCRKGPIREACELKISFFRSPSIEQGTSGLRGYSEGSRLRYTPIGNLILPVFKYKWGLNLELNFEEKQ